MKSNFNYDQDSTIAELYLSGLTCDGIAKLCGVYHQSVANSLRRSGVKIRKTWKRASGSANGRWNGGHRLIKGYTHLLIPNHHLARKDGYVPEHRLVMETKLGRKLLPGEVVNHIDGNILNNHPDNLSVYKNNGDHIKSHIVNFKRNNKGVFIK